MVEPEGDFLVERAELEFLLLADHAEAVNGKLYLMGGGWDRRGIVDFRQPQAFAVAIGLLIPWNETNRPIPLRMTLRDVDGADVAPSLQTEVVIGRPANAMPGQKLRYMLAVNLQVALPRPGQYVVEARAGAGPPRRVSFFVDPTPAPPG